MLPSPCRADEIGVAEAAYRMDGTEQQWLTGLAEAISPLLDTGHGVAAVHSRLDQALEVCSVAAFGGPRGLIEGVTAAARFGSRAYLRPWVRSGPCTSFGRIVNASPQLQAIFRNDPSAQTLFRLGIRDSLSIISIDPREGVVCLNAYRDKATKPTREQRSRWSRVASHLGAGLRLRKAIMAASGAGSPRAEMFRGSEAVLTPDGAVRHAEEPAKRARGILARAVVAMDRARTSRQREDQDAALEGWRGLVAGRWSLVEQFDTDGKRFIVARKNDPRIAAPAALALRERQVLACRSRGLSLKLIAYDLGVSLPTVSRALQSGMSKLGLRSEADLVALFFESTSS
jgi:DNA-binding CsgD family transcriptional regulator